MAVRPGPGGNTAKDDEEESSEYESEEDDDDMDEDMRLAIQLSRQEAGAGADKFGTKTKSAQDKAIGRPTKGKGLNQQFGNMQVTDQGYSENEAMMMDTKGFNKFLAMTEEQ